MKINIAKILPDLKKSKNYCNEYSLFMIVLYMTVITIKYLLQHFNKHSTDSIQK